MAGTPCSLLRIDAWISRFEARDDDLLTRLEADYDRGRGELTGVLAAYRDVLDRAGQLLGPATEVGILRSPGRINLMGRHVDHQGGHCNLMAIEREVLLVFHPRDDSAFHLSNVDPDSFPPQSFALSDLVGRPDRIQAQSASRTKRARWGVYFQAAALRIQERFLDIPLRGFDAVASGNIPMAAGLSSSSALVVACAETLVRINRLPLCPETLVDECGEGEKYVGTRGGSADHAAIRLSQPGRILHVSFFPFRIERSLPFPPNLCAVVCHSGEEAHKAAGARNIFNARVTSYAMARELIRHRFPFAADRVRHLRDINEETLGVTLDDLYRILASLPEHVDRSSFINTVSRAVGERIERDLFDAHDEPPEGYPLRGVALYGVAECCRSSRFADLLEQGDCTALGEQMLVSHKSERSVRHAGTLRPAPVRHDMSDRVFEDLIRGAEAGDPAADLWRQPGYYGCSTPGIDLIVDAAMQVPGVYGAQLAGAGLGGCAMVLADTSAVPALEQKLAEAYYLPRGLPPRMIPCRPVRGCECL